MTETPIISNKTPRKIKIKVRIKPNVNDKLGIVVSEINDKRKEMVNAITNI